MSHRLIPQGLYAILDCAFIERGEVGAVARALAASGAAWVQLRWKGATGRELVRAATEVREALAGTRALFIVNDRPDVARIAGAHGVHLGQDDVPPEAARRVLGDDGIVGLSTHSLEQVIAAAAEPVDYVAFGPVFATQTKADHEPVTGLEALREACVRAGRPVVAIGGITVARARAVRESGATAVAMVSALYGGGDPAARVAEAVRVLR